MGYDLNKAGFVSATPYLAMSILLFVFGYTADWVQIKGYLTTTQVSRNGQNFRNNNSVLDSYLLMHFFVGP